jgi:AraC-like DNA-binding protein
VLSSISLLTFYHIQSASKQKFIESAVVQRELPPAFYLIVGLVYLHVVIYIIISLHKVLQYREEIKQKFSSIHKINLNWLVFLLISLSLILLMSLINLLTPVTGPKEWFDYTLLIVIIVLFLFINVVVLKGLKQPEIFAGIEEKRSNEIPLQNHSTSIETESNLIREKLEKLMHDEKVFLDPELNLEMLAVKTGKSPKRLSQFINTTYEKNFFDYVNSYRIQEAMRILKESPDPRLTVLEAMYQSGFNSKSSFNTIFKSKTGMTPTAFRRQFLPS